ncbi:YbdD/YjiX family protein [Pseudoclavibacter helvolus]|uniref:Uncharacterized short protein YbdD (DUF466 family) n=1 Tax=Pseudoclavibacter helvolus TaxID=255205 RepID=A0A7W4URT9_9MICO|nr:YbdD/YjiX family protein [Pseudoclavibacter helvolus]MBB2959333.1 uncharacterized short protein YbdD (DUF466 family) [Pseudoclavibacter helvolus]
MTASSEIGSGMRSAAGAVGRAARAVRWYVRSMMGDNAYEVYVAHQRRAHPGVEPMGERAFWRERTDEQDRNPQGRCC